MNWVKTLHNCFNAETFLLETIIFLYLCHLYFFIDWKAYIWKKSFSFLIKFVLIQNINSLASLSSDSKCLSKLILWNLDFFIHHVWKKHLTSLTCWTTNCFQESSMYFLDTSVIYYKYKITTALNHMSCYWAIHCTYHCI